MSDYDGDCTSGMTAAQMAAETRRLNEEMRRIAAKKELEKAKSDLERARASDTRCFRCGGPENHDPDYC